MSINESNGQLLTHGQLLVCSISDFILQLNANLNSSNQPAIYISITSMKSVTIIPVHLHHFRIRTHFIVIIVFSLCLIVIGNNSVNSIIKYYPKKE